MERWSVFENVTQEVLGEIGDGTSIDFDEPFVARFLNSTYINEKNII